MLQVNLLGVRGGRDQWIGRGGLLREGGETGGQYGEQRRYERFPDKAQAASLRFAWNA
jgi:hypothetical protein